MHHVAGGLTEAERRAADEEEWRRSARRLRWILGGLAVVAVAITLTARWALG